MINGEVILLLEEISKLSEKDQDILMKSSINNYAERSVKNSMNLLSWIPDVVQSQFKLMRDIAMKNYQAASWAVTSREFKPKGQQYFAALVPTAMVLFPNGTSDGTCLAHVKFFNEFLALYKKEFNWDKDANWAKDCGYEEFFRKLDLNIKEGKI